MIETTTGFVYTAEEFLEHVDAYASLAVEQDAAHEADPQRFMDLTVEIGHLRTLIGDEWQGLLDLAGVGREGQG